MANVLVIRNQQKMRRVNRALLRQVVLAALNELAPGRGIELGLHLVSAKEITRLNEQFLQHAGATDVITFNLSEEAEGAGHGLPLPFGGEGWGEGDGRVKTSNIERPTANVEPPRLVGEIYICVEMAVSQARTFRATWQAEVARYAVHGLLHLLGYDDAEPAQRRTMKRAENRLMRGLSRRFSFGKLASS